MDLYEYQGKQLFRRFGIPVSEGRLATSPEEARAAAVDLGGPVVVKAQVLTGGRGKAGGVKLAEGPVDAEQRAREILGLDIRGPPRAQALDRARVRHREGVLPLPHVRPVGEEAAFHAHDERRRRDRAGRGGESRRTRAAARQRPRELSAVPGAAPHLRRRHLGSRRAAAGARHHRKALRVLHGVRRDAVRDQPADRDPRRNREGARRKGDRGRRRAVPASGHRGDAGRRRGRPARGICSREGRDIREARRLGRNPRQRRRALDVDGRRRRRGRWAARELLRPRRRWRRRGRRGRARGDRAGSRRPLHLLQHLRRDHALRRGRAGDPRGARADVDRAADGRTPRRHERPRRAERCSRATPNLYVEPTMLDAARRAVELAA